LHTVPITLKLLGCLHDKDSLWEISDNIFNLQEVLENIHLFLQTYNAVLQVSAHNLNTVFPVYTIISSSSFIL